MRKAAIFPFVSLSLLALGGIAAAEGASAAPAHPVAAVGADWLEDQTQPPDIPGKQQQNSDDRRKPREAFDSIDRESTADAPDRTDLELPEARDRTDFNIPEAPARRRLDIPRASDETDFRIPEAPYGRYLDFPEAPRNSDTPLLAAPTADDPDDAAQDDAEERLETIVSATSGGGGHATRSAGGKAQLPATGGDYATSALVGAFLLTVGGAMYRVSRRSAR